MTVDLESIQTAYRRYAHFYDFVFGSIFHPGRCSAIDHLHCQPGERILEVGVGTGLSLPLYPSTVKVVGIDLSEAMLEKAKTKAEKEKLSHVEDLLTMNAQDMKFPDDSFDKVVAMYVASVVPDKRQLVNEISRVCKPGGTIIFLNHFESNNLIMKKLEALLKPFAKTIGFHPDLSLNEFLADTGFIPTQIVPANVFGYWSLLIGRNHKKSSS